METETDLKRIAQLGEERDDENWEFRTFLKCLDMSGEELDAVVHQITAEVTSQIDCTKCANCCKQISPLLDQEDISVFAQGLKMPVSEFEKRYLSPSENDPSKYKFTELPCPFLQGERCTNYEHRPKDCRSYPHLHKSRFISRLWGVVDNYSICPIVFNVYERLKAELWHHRTRDNIDVLWV